MLTYILSAAAAGLIVSVGIVAAAKRWAERRRFLDHPNERSLHVNPMPRGGGIGIVVPVCVAMSGLALMAPETRFAACWLTGVSLLMAGVGLIDDVRGLPAVTRLTVHVLAAGALGVALGAWPTLEWPGLLHVDLGGAAVPFTVLLLAGFTNAYNFMDGVDGIAGSQGVVSGLGWTAAGYAVQDPVLAVAGAVIATSSLGFLFFNWPPASVFMGDVGSSFLGFLLAALAVYASHRSAVTALAGILFVWPFVFDTAFTLFRRAGRRENLLIAHRSHLYQRLVLTGMSHRTVTLTYATLAAIGVAVGLCLVCKLATASAVGGVVIVGLAFALWRFVITRERARGD